MSNYSVPGRGPPSRPMNRMGGDFNPRHGPPRDMYRNDPMLGEMLRREGHGAAGGLYLQSEPLMRRLDPLALQAQVLVIDPERRCRSYAEMILCKLKRIGLICEILILDKFMSPSQVIDDATARGLLYTASVNLQNELHQSITINILQGQPQEHRNMPFEDALKLVTRNFDAHLLKLDSSKADPAPVVGSVDADNIDDIDPTLSLLLINLAEGKSLRLSDLDKVIEYLNRKRERLAGAPKRSVTQNIKTIENTAPAPKPVQPPNSAAALAASTQQAEDLQAKITKLFGDSNKQQSTVGVKPTASVGAPLFPASNNAFASSTSQQDQKKKAVGIDFSNPTVQSALQNLMKTGPNILDSIRNTSTAQNLDAPSSIPTITTIYTSASGNGDYDSRTADNTYSHLSSQPKTSQGAEEYMDASRPAKRAKPGRHAIAGFY